MNTSPLYRGRFAPSPSGRLHFGSLVTAVASYLDARTHQGTWIVRMEDLDPPREEAGAADAILRCLAAHGLHSDEPVIYQSQRLSHYDDLIHALMAKNLAYRCNCNRKRLSDLAGIYDGHCRLHSTPPNEPAAVRIKLYDAPSIDLPETLSFRDRVQGVITQNLRTHAGDQVIKRRDGLHGYTLAVLADDIEQGVTHIVRGADLLEVTPRHLAIYSLLEQSQILPSRAPVYGHTPLVITANGYKLSKQNRAPAIDDAHASHNLVSAIRFLGLNPEAALAEETPETILQWASGHFHLESLNHRDRQMPLSD